MCAHSLGQAPIIHKINDFLANPKYIAVIMLLTVLSNLFGLELAVYTFFIAILIYINLFGKDLLPSMPIVICCYLALSTENNPGRNENSILSANGAGPYFVALVALLSLTLIYRIVRDHKQFFGRKYQLLSGMVILTITYLLGGIGSNDYLKDAYRSIFFAFLNGTAIIVPYLLIAGGVDWSRARKDYLAWTGFGIGCVLLCEITWIYLTGNVIINGVIERSAIYTGWGMYNNIGSLLAMMIPFPFFLATKYRKGWIGTLVGSLFLIGVLLTCSRGSILCGVGIYFLCVLLMLYYANDRKANTLTLIFFMGGISLLLAVFSRPLLNLFSSLLDHGLDPSNRDAIYRDGMYLFAKYPIFGGSFFSSEYTPWGWSTNAAFNQFFPPRWHNTFVQLLASCGVVGLAGYLVHRVQTVLLFVRDLRPEKIFAACSLTVLLACSLVDCHFFNIGPVLFYAMALAFAEKCKDN